MLGDVVTPIQRAEIFPVLVIVSLLINKSLLRKSLVNSLVSTCSLAIFQPIYLLVILIMKRNMQSDVIAILLGRKPETFEEFVTSNKAAIHGN